MESDQQKTGTGSGFEKRIDDFSEEVEKIGKTVEQRIQKSVSSGASNEPRRLYRSGKEKLLGGVCGGIAEYLNVDPVVIRLVWIAASLVFGIGILLYIIAWIIIPRNPNHQWN